MFVVLGCAMTIPSTVGTPKLTELSQVPVNPLPRRVRIRQLREFHTGCEVLRDAGGPVTRLNLGPSWLMPPVVVATSPRAGRDILGRTDAFVEKTVVHREMRHLLGNNLFDLEHDAWLPRRRALQPVFTKTRVDEFAGQMVEAADAVAGSWADGAMWLPTVARHRARIAGARLRGCSRHRACVQAGPRPRGSAGARDAGRSRSRDRDCTHRS